MNNVLTAEQPVEPRKPHNSQWVVVTFKRSFLWGRQMAERDGDADETWMINAPRRYILNANQLDHVKQYVESISDLKTSAYYKPLTGKVNLAGSRILVERYRDRGIGDLLFLTGPLSYLQHLSGNTCKVYLYSLADRGHAVYNHPAIHCGVPQYGPILYDDLPLYHYHWLIDTVTEYDEEPEQLNVYDALYKSLGLDYENIDIRFKRPSISLDDTDNKNVDSFYYFAYRERNGMDLRKTGYYVVAPLSHGNLRSMNYTSWLHIIRELAERRPVVVVGQFTARMPTTDMSADQFNQQLSSIHPGVVNIMGTTPLRVVMAIISKAVATVCLDSAPLYISQACRVPAISLWGPHHPGVRIGYDKDFMDLAIWNPDACRHAPCFAYSGFPAHKCPGGEQQSVCEVLRSVDARQVIDKMNIIEGARRGQSTFTAGAK